MNDQFRGHGFGRALLQRCMQYWQEKRCLRSCVAVPWHAKHFFLNLGFHVGNALSIDLVDNPARNALRKSGFHGSDDYLDLCLISTPHQLAAAFKGTDLDRIIAVQKEYGLWIDSAKNWVVDKIEKLGHGFDMSILAADPRRLQHKFDALAPGYSVWTVANRSKVEDWISRQARTWSSPPLRVADVACGIGLMTQQLRLLGFSGFAHGVDVSPKMVNEAQKRCVFNATSVANVNLGLPLAAERFDLCICTGALELLDQLTVLREIRRVLRSGGRLWSSFQAESDATSHMNIRGKTKDEVLQVLHDAGFSVVSFEFCADAFYTPKMGKFVPVPYFFVNAETK